MPAPDGEEPRPDPGELLTQLFEELPDIPQEHLPLALGQALAAQDDEAIGEFQAWLLAQTPKRADDEPDATHAALTRVIDGYWAGSALDDQDEETAAEGFERFVSEERRIVADDAQEVRSAFESIRAVFDRAARGGNAVALMSALLKVVGLDQTREGGSRTPDDEPEPPRTASF